MCATGKPVKETSFRTRSRGLWRLAASFCGVALLALLPICARSSFLSSRVARQASSLKEDSVGVHASNPAQESVAAAVWRDSLGDGFPDSARLESAIDRENFSHWFTFLAEDQYYAPMAAASTEIQDCAGLVRFAYRNALISHSPAWRERAGLPYDPGFGDVASYHYPFGPLREKLFRSRPGPLAPEDQKQGAFVEFADSSTLLRYNTYLVSRDLRAAQPGDLLFFHQAVQHESFHTMIFVGRSRFQSQDADWIVYHTGEVNGHRGEIREVRAETLLQHPDPHWRPVLNNPNFMGVYRWEILR